MQTQIHRFRAAWTTKPERSFWPADLEPLSDLWVEPDPAPSSFGFFLNADDTPRCGAPVQPWPEPIRAVVYRPLPAFRDLVADEERTWAA